jgi:uncharacterized membrane protein YfcA
MDSTSQTLWVIAIILLSTFTRSALGFGDALIAMPLLAMVVGITTATPLVAMAASTIAIMILSRAWRDVNIRAAWRLILSSLVGIPIGLYFLKNAPEAIVKAVLGIVLIGFGLYNLISPKLPHLRNEKLSYLFGFGAGILGGAYNANGPLVVVYSALRRWSPGNFRATLQGYFFPTGFTVLISHGLADLWTPSVLRLYLYALPVILMGVIVGEIVNRRFSVDRFYNIVYIALILMGILQFV